jgi:hypothetical protein
MVGRAPGSWIWLRLLFAAHLAGAASPDTLSAQTLPQDAAIGGVASAVAILARDGRHVRIQSRQWVSGTVVRFAGGLVLRITDLGPEHTGGIVLEGDVRSGERLGVEAISVPVAPVHIGGRTTSSLRSLIRELEATMPVVLLEGDSGFAPDLEIVADRDRIEVLLRGGGLRRHIPAGEEGALRALLVQEVVLRQLAVLDNPAAAFSVALVVEVDDDGSRARADRHPLAPVGSEIRFRVTSGRDGYLTLINLSPDGTVALLSSEADGPNQVRAGSETVVPSWDSGAVFRAEYPVGLGLVRALVTPAPIPFPDGLIGMSFPDATALLRAVEVQLGVTLGADHVRAGRDAVANWSGALALYEVFDPY